MQKRCSTLLCLAVFAACNLTPSAWDNFTQCGTNACVAEALAVKDAFLNDPKTLLGQFQKTYEKGDDHVVGWLYLLRDSVLVNSAFGSVETRFQLQQQLLEAARPLAADAKLGEMARTVIAEIEILAIASELEDDIFEAPAPITGTFAYELPQNGGSGELLIRQTGLDKFRFQLTVVGPPPAHNQGLLEGEATFTATNLAEFETTTFGSSCKIQFLLTADSVQINSLAGDAAACGFGNRVSAAGAYRRVNYETPFLTKAEAQTAKNLEGDWVSADDPKSEIQIAKGLYTDRYDGEDLGGSPYLFSPKCPESCAAPEGTGPCLQVLGQDEMCYAVVFANGKTLQLSLIGGTGKTLHFKRK